MERKEFLRKGLLGTGIFAASSALGGLVANNIDEIKALEIIGFNHIPNTNSKLMKNTVLHKAETRGQANHGWLDARHSFSFANYYNPERMHFGVLRVLNDDHIAGGSGFGTHPHDNMEIITIPLEGALAHKDSMGNAAVIQSGDIQMMSAGTGIQHSEFNNSEDEPIKLLQIWMFPNKKGVTPRYDQISLSPGNRHNKLEQILSPNADDAGVWVYQDAWFYLGKFDENTTAEYSIKKSGNGVYAFVINGQWNINGQDLDRRDGFGIWDIDKLTITSKSAEAEILIMDVPMQTV